MKFYDTSSLLLKTEYEEPFIISSITLNELEGIKTSNGKDLEIKIQARKLLHYLMENADDYQIVIYSEQYLPPLREAGIEITNDTKILACAIASGADVFVTNDFALANIARLFFDKIEMEEPEKEDYTGFKEVILDEKELNDLYTDPSNNFCNLLTNEYLIVRNSENEVVDIRLWNGSEMKYIKSTSFCSDWFGEIRPYKNDIYQKLLFDCLVRNQMTVIRGPAGSGKSMIALGYLISLLEHNKIDKIIIFTNTVATADSAKLGYLPGTREEKLLDSQIGNFLSSKLGGREGVEKMIEDERLILLPMSDIRGYDTTGMRAGVYVTEAQNLNKPLMKLVLQRIGEDSICILDGDDNAQVDLEAYRGYNNGLKRVSQVYRGKDFYGEITLKNIYRSKIALIAENI